jgi:hypothetical protein
VHPAPRRRPGRGVVAVTAALELPLVAPAALLAERHAASRVLEAAVHLLAALELEGDRRRLSQEAYWQARRLGRAVAAAQQASAGPLPPVMPSWPPQHPELDRAQAELAAWLATQPWADPDRGPYVYVYLLCFRDPATGAHRPYRGRPRVGNGGQAAGHYTGSTIELPRRVAEHRAGRNSVPLLEAALADGLTFWLADVEVGTPGLEQRRKRQGSAYRRCPLCRGTGEPLDPAAVAAAVPLPASPNPDAAGGVRGCLGVSGGGR